MEDPVKSPADMTWEEFSSEYPGVDRELHAAMIRDRGRRAMTRSAQFRAFRRAHGSVEPEKASIATVLRELRELKVLVRQVLKERKPPPGV